MRAIKVPLGRGDVAYRGPDRRTQRRADPPPALPSRGTWTAGLALAALSAPAAVVLALHGSLPEAVRLERLFAAVATAAAGAGALVCWRLQGTAFEAWSGASLATTGLLLVTTSSAPLLGLAARPGAETLQALVVAGLAAWLWTRALVAAEVEARVAPVRVTAVAALCGVVLVGDLGLIARRGLVPAALIDPLDAGVPLLAAACVWLALAAAAAAVHARCRRGGLWVPAFLAAVAAGGLVRVGLGAESEPGALAAAVLSGGAAAVAVAATAARLRLVVAGTDRRELHLRVDVEHLREELCDQRDGLREQLHDLRNAVTGLRSADATLRRYADELDPASRATLADTVSLELARLQVLIEPARQARELDFDIGLALRAVCLAERSLGTDVGRHARGVEAHGDPDALAQVVQNLLVNARRYAPGSPVWVTATADGSRAEILVCDEGPGIAEAERARVFLRGARGAAAAGTPGDGLGLHVAGRLMATTGGHLRLVDGPTRGACFLLELPASAPGDAAPRPPDGRKERSRGVPPLTTGSL